MAEREQRLDDIESSVADLRDEADDIWPYEVNDQLQQIIHTLETMNNKIEGLHNRMKAQGRLLFLIVAGVTITALLAIGVAAVAVMLLERLL